MSYSYRASTSGGNGSGGAVSISKPAGVAAGDLIVVAAYLESDTNTWTPDASFTSLASQVNTGLFSLQVWYRWADGSEPASWAWTPASSNWRTIVCVAWSGGPGSGSPLDISAGAQGDGDLVSNQNAPSVTTTAADDLLVFVYGNYSGISPGDTTGAATNMRVTLGGLTIGDATIASAGATGTSGPDSAVGTEDWAALHIALLASGGGGGSLPVDADYSWFPKKKLRKL